MPHSDIVQRAEVPRGLCYSDVLNDSGPVTKPLSSFLLIGTVF